MQLETKKLLHDIKMAGSKISDYTREKDFAHYQGNSMLRSAVERQMQVVGEALNQLKKIDAETTGKIPDHRQVIAFRNILVHAYAQIDDRIVWGIVTNHLPQLLAQVKALLDDGR